MAHEDEASTVSIIRLGFTAFYAPTEPKQAEAAIESVALNPCIYVRVRKAEACRGAERGKADLFSSVKYFNFWLKKDMHIDRELAPRYV